MKKSPNLDGGDSTHNRKKLIKKGQTRNLIKVSPNKQATGNPLRAKKGGGISQYIYIHENYYSYRRSPRSC